MNSVSINKQIVVIEHQYLMNAESFTAYYNNTILRINFAGASTGRKGIRITHYAPGYNLNNNNTLFIIIKVITEKIELLLHAGKSRLRYFKSVDTCKILEKSNKLN